jgi:hypothetical protein
VKGEKEEKVLLGRVPDNPNFDVNELNFIKL